MSREKNIPSRASLPPTLLVGFWDIALDNFPEGTFRHSKLPQTEAIEMINAVKASRTVLFGTSHDLAAPYKKRELRKTTELVSVLSQHWGLDITIDDLFSEVEDGLKHAIPMTLNDIRSDQPLIVVTCHYVWDRTTKGDDLGMSVAPDSVAFHLFELTMSP